MIADIEKSKIKTKLLSFKLNDQVSVDYLEESFNHFPYILICKLQNTNGTESKYETSIDPKDIVYFKLINSKFLPEIELYCEDSKGILFNDLYPYDHDTLISVFFKSKSELTSPIRMDFRVTEYETLKQNEGLNVLTYAIKGILNVDDLHFSRYESRRGTSYKVIKDIALQMNLGFSSNVRESNDEMTWINPNDTYKEFIKDITRYSWISENSFIWTFIDFNYNLNYVDIQLELNEFLKNEQEPSRDTSIEKNAEEKIVSKYLTNNAAFSSSNKYITKFNLANNSFKVNLEKFYKMKATWYDKIDNTITKEYVKELETDQSKLGTSEGYLNQLHDKTARLFCENLNDEFFIGKIDSKNNVHKNYALAKVANKYNLDNLEKMTFIVTLNKINFSIKRFQNIKIEIYNILDVLSKDADTKSPVNNLNTTLSGYWYVTGINYVYKRSGGIEQEISLMRRDLSVDYGVGNDSKNDFRKYSNE